MEMILSEHQQQYGGFTVGSLFDTCDNVPSHEDSLKADSRWSVCLSVRLSICLYNNLSVCQLDRLSVH